MGKHAVLCPVFSLETQKKKVASWCGRRGCEMVGNLLQGDVSKLIDDHYFKKCMGDFFYRILSFEF